NRPSRYREGLFYFLASAARLSPGESALQLLDGLDRRRVDADAHGEVEGDEVTQLDHAEHPGQPALTLRRKLGPAGDALGEETATDLHPPRDLRMVAGIAEDDDVEHAADLLRRGLPPHDLVVVEL